jgi:uncharacterized protein
MQTQIDFKSDGSGVVEGYASTWGTVDSQGDIVEQGAFSKSLESKREVAMLWSHLQSQPVGKWLNIVQDGRGLFVRGQLNLDTNAGREAFAHARAGDISGFSIGYRIAEGGAYVKNGVRHLTEVDLLEISLVTIPANDSARVTLVKSTKPQTIRELENLLHKAGFSRRESVRIAAHGFNGDGQDVDLQLAAQNILSMAQKLQRL